MGWWVSTWYANNDTELCLCCIGLDPANFIPDLSVIDDHIDPTDAQQVDIIHTDQFSGILQSLGTVDFFVNGGAHQAGCPDIAAGEQDPGI